MSKYIYLKKSDLFHKNIQINVDKQTRGFSLSKMYILNNFMLYPFEKTKKNLEISNLGCKYILGVRNHTLWLSMEAIPNLIKKMQRFLFIYCQSKSSIPRTNLLFITEKVELKDYFRELSEQPYITSLEIHYWAARWLPGTYSNWLLSRNKLYKNIKNNITSSTNLINWKFTDFLVVAGVTNTGAIIKEIKKTRSKTVTFGLIDVMSKEFYDWHFCFPGYTKSIHAIYFICNLVLYCIAWAKWTLASKITVTD